MHPAAPFLRWLALLGPLALLELEYQHEAEASELAGQLAGFAGVELQSTLPSS